MGDYYDERKTMAEDVSGEVRNLFLSEDEGREPLYLFGGYNGKDSIIILPNNPTSSPAHIHDFPC